MFNDDHSRFLILRVLLIARCKHLEPVCGTSATFHETEKSGEFKIFQKQRKTLNRQKLLKKFMLTT